MKMQKKTNIAVIKCDKYEKSVLEDAVKKVFNYFPEFYDTLKPQMKVLLKPNVLSEAKPESCVDTHPEIIRAVARLVKQKGCKVIIGDSPGNAKANVKEIFEKSGIIRIAEEEDIEISYFNDNVVEYLNKNTKIKGMEVVHIAKTPLEADVIINLPKFKTHNLMNFTGAVKNMFGVIPGFNKSKYHILFPTPKEFAKALLEIFKIVKPHFTIMDAIMGMEGHGPQGGKPKFIGAVIGGYDCISIDTYCSSLIGYKYSDVYTNIYGDEYNLGNGILENINILGDVIKPFKKGEFELVRNLDYILNRVPRILYILLKPLAKRIRIEPEIIKEKCTGCSVCLNGCPSKTIKLDKNKKANIDYKNCIMCFCCHELCEYKAIGIRRSWLAKRLQIG